tara:strand:- start:484 stop:1053 length:570 start_codon:yes stop_codon:yes gene_type:complete
MRGGGTRSNLFEVKMSFPEYLGTEDGSELTADIPFLVKAAEIPASNLGNIPVPFRGRVLPIAGDRTFDPWTVTVINDTNFRVRDAMERWSNGINDLQTAQGFINPEIYQKSATVTQLNRGINGQIDPQTSLLKDDSNIEVLRTYKFEGIYPNVVSSIPLDHGATDQIEEFQVTFNYLFYEVTPKVGTAF